jgi:hypothetical protein
MREGTPGSETHGPGGSRAQPIRVGNFLGIPVHLVVYFLIPKCKDHKSEERCVEGNRTVKARLWGITSESA